MHLHLLWIGLVGILILNSKFSSGQDEIPSPKFPVAFQTEVQGIFRNEMTEVDASLYYDRPNNRAALFYTYRNESTKNIYDFNSNLFLSIQGNDCGVSKLTDDTEGSFFPFTQDQKSKSLTLGTPEELFYFTNSTQLPSRTWGMTIFPTVIYVGNVNFPVYHRTNCNVTHIFTTPVVEVPDCSDHKCQPSLIAISVVCPETEDKHKMSVNHEYSFFRFRSGISDESVFQPPPGIHCDIVNRVPFPGLSEYFSFSYDLVEGIADAKTGSGVFYDHRKVWYDSKLQLLRIDEFEDGFLESSKIFDKYGGVTYEIDAGLVSCNSAPMGEKIPFEELTTLPIIMFQKNIADNSITYVGKRKAHGLEYDVWSSSLQTDVPGRKQVQEFYFNKMVTSMGEEGKLQLSHVDIYMYSLNKETDSYELKRNAYLIINNLRSEPKEWEAFDISACFTQEQRKGFRLNVTGPGVIKDSILYENLLERMYMKIIFVTKVSLIRISELAGVFDGTHMTEFSGWILEKPDVSGADTRKSEPDMLAAYELLKNAASSGKLNIKVKTNGQEFEYIVGVIEEMEKPTDKPTTASSGSPLSGGALAAIVMMSIVSVILIGWGIYVFQKKRADSDLRHVQMDALK